MLVMENDNDLLLNSDWDPVYLAYIFNQDFFDMSYLWSSELVSDSEMLKIDGNVEKYIPIMEDISLEDDVLCDAVNRIEQE